MTRRLAAAGAASPEAEAWAMLERISGRSRLELIAAAPLALAPEQATLLETWLEQRAAGRPLQHLLGVAPFYGVELEIGPDALVPRPETERLVEMVLTDLAPVRDPVVLDVGTGSGAIAVAIARERPDAEVWASEVDPAALALARRNVARWAPRVRAVASDLLDAHELAPLLPRLDLLVANPPYLMDSDEPQLPRDVLQDPRVALYGGRDGLGIWRRLLDQAQGRLPARASLWFELDPRNVHVARDEAAAKGYRARVHEDMPGRPRFLEARRS